MNRSQQIVLLSAFALTLLIGLYPPWLFVVEMQLEGVSLHDSKQAGYSPLLLPPEIPPDDPYSGGPHRYDGVFHRPDARVQVRLDFQRLAAEWITLIVGTVLLLLALKRKA